MGTWRTLDPTQAENVISVDEMRGLEATVIESGAVSGFELMRRAGQGVTDAVASLCPEGDQKVVVLCGPGNNGGDGFVVATLLLARGYTVEVYALAGQGAATGDAALAEQGWLGVGALRPWAGAAQAVSGADLVVDALFGIGLTRPLGGVVASLVTQIPATATCVAIDVPSGYGADGEGQLGQVAVNADLVVTFHRPKAVHLDLARAGVRVLVADIGL